MTDEREDLAALRRRIEAIRAERGFLLPHHGAMATAFPALEEAYFAMYRELTLTDRHLAPLEREFIWIAILIATKQAVGTHHLTLFRQAGGTDAQGVLATRLTALALGADAFAFVDRSWAGWFEPLRGPSAYRDAATALMNEAPVPRGLGHLAMAAVHTAAGSLWGLEAHIEAAYAEAVPEDKLAEALSLTIWPAGVNRFVDACGAWHGLMAQRRVEPSARYRIWADTAGQTGHRRTPDAQGR